MDKKRDKKRSSGETTTTGWLIPVEVKDSFTKFCTTKGSIIKEDCAGALLIWQYLPPEIREWARLEAKGISSVDQPETTLHQKLQKALSGRGQEEEYSPQDPVAKDDEVHELKYRLEIVEGLLQRLTSEQTKQGARQAKQKGAS
jgi:hypothetical protein